ncbi:MAG: M28 family peptidase [Planctomycetota bacterium]
MTSRFALALAAAVLALPLSPLRAQDAPTWKAPEPSEEEIATFRRHVEFLADPFLKGRWPGTPEMAMARDYIEFHMRAVGLQPAFGGTNANYVGDGATTFRQDFHFNQKRTATSASLSVAGGEIALPEGSLRGSAAGAEEGSGEMVFVGYGIPSGTDDWVGLADDDSFDGKIAVAFLFEPLDAEGRSQWKKDGGWSNRSSLRRRLRELSRRGAAGAILIVPPGVDADVKETMDELATFSARIVRFPVVALDAKGGAALLAATHDKGDSLEAIRARADAGRCVFPLNGVAEMKIEIGLSGGDPASNVGGIIPGRGKLAKELVVVGAHIDHLGLGYRGSRARNRAGEIHPGADDNASGTAAIIMIGRRIVDYYKTLPPDADARSVLILGLDAEEQGLHGAAYYTRNPLVPIEDHQLMINFDMIGRITDHQIRVDGMQSGTGLIELCQPLFAESGLKALPGDSIMMASDHARFFAAGVPILFSIITPFHDDYHTPEDTVQKINSVDAVRVVEVYAEIARRAATMPEDITFTNESKMPKPAQGN